jgi:hypothetical protein
MSVLTEMKNHMVEMKQRVSNTGDDFSDPQKTYATITRNEYEDFVKQFGGYEDSLIASVTETPAEDTAREDSIAASERQKAIQKRNLERYGTELTVAERSEMGRSYQRGRQLDIAGTTNDARIADIERTTNLRNTLANIASGVYGGAIQGLGNASSNAASRQQAYKQARAQNKANTISTIGTIAGAALMFGI